MKLSCEVIRDLLPLYQDGACSPESRKLVEEHLRECEACQALIRENEMVPELELRKPLPAEEVKVVKGFRKLRRRWVQSLVAVLLLIPLLCMMVAQIMGRGICFTSLDDILLAKRYVKALQDGDMERAAELFDYDAQYQELKELAGRAESDYLPHWEQVEIAGEKFYFNLDSDIELTEEELHQLDLGTILHNSRWRALIPIGLWNEFLHEAGPDPELENGKTYIPVETPWGSFMSPIRLDEGDTAEAYTVAYQLLPAEVYESMEADLIQSGREWYEKHQRVYGPILTQAPEEFALEMKAKYTASLEEGFRNAVVDGIRYGSAYASENGGWQVEIGAVLRMDGKEYDGRFILFTDGGRITSIGSSGWADSKQLDELTDHTYPRYWDEEDF